MLNHRHVLVVALLVSTACKKEMAPAAPAAEQPALEIIVPADVHSVAVLPCQSKGQSDASLLSVMDDLVLSSLQKRAGERLRIVAKTDIDALLDIEKTKDALGCDEVGCAVEIARALGVDSILSARLGMLGRKHLLSLTWMKQSDASVIHRTSGDLGANVERFDRGIDATVLALLTRGDAGPASDEGSEPPPPAAAQQKFDVAGFYNAVHPHWSGSLIIASDGTYHRGENGDPGVWTFDGNTLVLKWKNWAPETLVMQQEGVFIAPSNGFRLLKVR